MNYEPWMLSVLIGVFNLVAVFAIMKNNVDLLQKAEKDKEERLSVLENRLSSITPLIDGLSNIAQTVAVLQATASQSPSRQEIHDKFVTKEFLEQLERHFDNRFNQINDNLSQILAKLDAK